MLLSSGWIWVAAAVVGWVFLGLIAGRFRAVRRQMGGAKPIVRAASGKRVN